MVAATRTEELIRVGLVVESANPILTDKGRSWLRTLEDLEGQEVADIGEGAADLILSTSGLVR